MALILLLIGSKTVSGITGEKMFTHLMEMAGYENEASKMKPAELVDKAEVARPGRLANVKAKREEASKTTRWNVTSSQLIIDWVYGLDYILDADGNGNLFGFDVTLNPASVAGKLDKLNSFKPLNDSIGVKKVGVVLLVPSSPNWGIALLSKEQKDDLIDRLLDQVVYAMDESSGYARQYILAV